ncbi:mucin TcMUCII, putative, partial [Trypanosoma cruzi marinkellei]
SVCVSAFTSRLPCCSPCPSLCRSAPHHRTTTLTMMKNCRLLCALLVLALCCCPAVCVTDAVGAEQGESSGLPATPPQVLSRENIPLDLKTNTNPDPVSSGEPGRPELAAAGEPSGGPSVTQNTIVAPGHSGSAGGETIPPVLTAKSVPLLFTSPSSICVLVLRRTVHAWLPPSPHVCFALCVCVCFHLSSPLLLSMSLTVQISSTPPNDHTHDDEELPSAVRPVGARPVLLPSCVRDRCCWRGTRRKFRSSSHTSTGVISGEYSFGFKN